MGTYCRRVHVRIRFYCRQRSLVRRARVLGQRGLIGGLVERLAKLGQIGVLFHAFGNLFKFGTGLLSDVAAGLSPPQRRCMTAHERQQLAFFLIKHKQFFGQRRLVAEHVDQEAQRAQVVAQVLESTCCAGLCFVDLGVQNRVDRGPHARHGLHRLIQPEHREHAPHLRQL